MAHKDDFWVKTAHPAHEDMLDTLCEASNVVRLLGTHAHCFPHHIAPGERFVLEPKVTNQCITINTNSAVVAPIQAI